VLLIGAVSVVPAGAAPQPAAPSAAALSATEAAADGTGEEKVGAPSAKDLQTQRDYLERLKDDVAQHSDALIKAQADQAAAAAAVSVALEEYAVTERALSEANAEENRRRDLLLQAQLDLAQHKAALGRWAREAYQQGQVGADYGTMLTLLSSGPTDDLGNTLTSLNRIGRSRSRSVERLDQARSEQARAAAAAKAATTKAVSAATEASSAKEKRDAAFAKQQAAVVALQQQLSLLTGRKLLAQHDLNLMQTAADRAATYLDDSPTGPTGDGCTGGELSGYPNGQLPWDALCPLWGSAGNRLRADAAYGFNQLSQGFAAAFGGPICVTDSYRTYEAQVDLYRRKPNLAARPGTSNHGWGTAVDLCGGIQSFSTAQHQWMVVNAPAFGWFHPSWARQGGSRPEPWHFEYGG
jgi:hypothetical protein